MRHLYRMALFIIIITSSFIVALPAHAGDATVSTCDFASLQAAITTANTGGGIITFACSGTITFTSELSISANVTINANGNAVIFDGGGLNRHFMVNGTLTLNDFTLQNGFGSGFTSDGGSIYNYGTITLNNVILTNNVGVFGGAVFNSTGANATFNTVTFSNNTGATGGALRNRGTTNLNNSIFINNTASGTGGAIASAAGTVNSQNTHYENNTCIGTITDNGGNTVLNATGCPGTATTNLSVSALSCSGNDAVFTINAGDANFDVTGTGGGLPQNNVGTGIITLTGPSTWSGVTVTELTGNLQSVNLGGITCPATIPLSANATCIGANLQVNIVTGDFYFEISADSGLLLGGASLNTHIISGPLNETNVTVTEFGGDLESLNLGNFNCFTSTTLTATATCNGADLQVTISNGNAPFSISVTDSNGVMNMGGQPLGVYTFTGPDTFSNIGITEDTGDLETITIPSVTCTAPVVPVVPVAPVVLSPDLNALGCELTGNVEMPNVSDNTYCRVLMRNGGVVGYSGAIPQELINLGVIFAVDVYQLRGGQAVNEFGGYQQICLSGEGRLFYMDSRNSPRGVIELATETIDGMTCGWIPAPGTLILTH